MNKFLDGLITALIVVISFVLIVTALILSVCVVLSVFGQDYSNALHYGITAFLLSVASLALINL